MLGPDIGYPGVYEDAGGTRMPRLGRDVDLWTAVGKDEMATSEEVQDELEAHVAELVAFAREQGERRHGSLRKLEREVSKRLQQAGRLLVLLTLTVAEERLDPATEHAGRSYVRRPRKGKWLGTIFGGILYFRTYLRASSWEEQRSGRHPLDEQWGVARDRYSMSVISASVRLATHVSFDICTDLLEEFWGWSPAKDSIEAMVLGLGAQTEDFFEQTPPPSGDGEVLVIQADSKGAPTATDSELSKRRRPRRKRGRAPSPRHRGRKRRKGWQKPRRRKPGDKRKNAKMATLIVMYTLKRKGNLLLGPINKQVYGSFAPKRHVFAWAAREAVKRGFDPRNEKSLIQFVSDGDPDLRDLAAEYLPCAIQTIDLYHVMEYVWSAGECLHKVGSGDLSDWVAHQKKRLLGGQHRRVTREIEDVIAKLRRHGRLSKGKRTRLETAAEYLRSNSYRLDYKWVREMDLELASGAVEGAVNHVMGKRLDNGGMRWIKERAEAVLKLRCIEVNGKWGELIEFVEQRTRGQMAGGLPVRISRSQPVPLPSLHSEEVAA